LGGPPEEVLRLLVEALRFHYLILAQGVAWPRSDCGASTVSLYSPLRRAGV
jgi:hypothetical protein